MDPPPGDRDRSVGRSWQRRWGSDNGLGGGAGRVAMGYAAL